MSLLPSLVARANALGASDLHLEPGLPAAMRVGGQLRTFGEPVSAGVLLEEARRLLPGALWTELQHRRSADLSRNLGGVRCRLNVLHSSRGIGFAVRLLSAFQATLDSLNLHPDLAALAHRKHGLVLVAGPTGSGKSSTVAALVQELNRSEARHILTLEQPIEHLLRPRRSYIHQREVGRDTPSFEQGLLDAMREDPDFIVVGEMRDPETMRLTLNAAETGHLVFSTVHSSSCPEALGRLVAAFPPETQHGVRAQLADCLVAVVCQRLVPWPDLGIRVPELEILVANEPVKAALRGDSLHKLTSMMQTGAADGMWTADRYRRWLAAKDRFFVPRQGAGEALPEDDEPLPSELIAPPAPAYSPVGAAAWSASSTSQVPASGARSPSPGAPATRPAPARAQQDGVIDLDGYDEDLGSILKDL